MTQEQGPDETMATPEQMEELRSLAEAAGEEIPSAMRESEAAQRIVELRSAGSSS